jgi:hypothetical protein
VKKQKPGWPNARIADLEGHGERCGGWDAPRVATLRQLSTEERKPVDTCADYLLKYQQMLKYDEYLAAGLPIATGVIEDACPHLIKDRMDITAPAGDCKARKPY